MKTAFAFLGGFISGCAAIITTIIAIGAIAEKDNAEEITEDDCVDEDVENTSEITETAEIEAA